MAIDDQAAGEVAAMQFAGGKSIAWIAEQWEREPLWVEEAIRRALLELIPERAGGLKVSRAEGRAERSEEEQAARAAQLELLP